MKKFFWLTLFVITIGMFVLPVATTYSAGLVPCGGSTEDPCTLCHLVVGFHELTTFFLKVLVVIALAGITISGVIYVVSAGSEKMITQAKGFLTASLIGFTVVLGAWIIVNTTMWLLAAKDADSEGGTLGIGITGSWSNFSCDETSPSATPAPSTSTGKCGSVPGTCDVGQAGSYYGNGDTAWNCTGNDGVVTPCSTSTVPPPSAPPPATPPPVTPPPTTTPPPATPPPSDEEWNPELQGFFVPEGEEFLFAVIASPCVSA